MIVAFEGWNDAGEAATEAVNALQNVWDSTPFASIDPEEFFDFTATRPHVVRGEDGTRSIEWPRNEFHLARPEGAPPVVLLSGTEPQLRWRTFSEAVLDVCTALDARLVLTLGSLLAEVPHSRPTNVFGSAADDQVAAVLGFEVSRYEGPTGIGGVLHDLCASVGRNAASLWATVPSYVPAAPSPKAARALAAEVCSILSVELPPTELDAEVDAYEQQISELVAENDDTATYVAHLEERYDQDAIAGDGAQALVTEVEAFLRDL